MPGAAVSQQPSQAGDHGDSAGWGVAGGGVRGELAQPAGRVGQPGGEVGCRDRGSARVTLVAGTAQAQGIHAAHLAAPGAPARRLRPRRRARMRARAAPACVFAQVAGTAAAGAGTLRGPAAFLLPAGTAQDRVLPAHRTAAGRARPRAPLACPGAGLEDAQLAAFRAGGLRSVRGDLGPAVAAVLAVPPADARPALHAVTRLHPAMPGVTAAASTGPGRGQLPAGPAPGAAVRRAGQREWRRPRTGR